MTPRLFLTALTPLFVFGSDSWKIPIIVGAGDTARVDKVVEASIAAASAGNLALREVDATGKIIDREVPFQVDDSNLSGKKDLTFLLKGRTPAGSTRRFELISGSTAATVPAPLIRLEALDNYEGEAALRIETPRATYVYHRLSGGFASLIDRDGNDWISYHPEGGFQGNFRGIPNIAPPDFHPGRPKGKKESRLLRQGTVCVSLLAETEDEQWATRWDIYPHYARMTLLRKGAQPYWILYEGTPGGSFDVESDYWVHSDGARIPVSAVTGRWNGRLPAPQWVYFGDSKMKRTLFFALHEADDAWDEFWHRGSGGMTVFGFGRGPKPEWQFLQTVPAHLTIGLVEEDEFPAVKQAIESSWRDIEVRAGAREPLQPPRSR